MKVHVKLTESDVPEILRKFFENGGFEDVDVTVIGDGSYSVNFTDVYGVITSSVKEVIKRVRHKTEE